MNDGAEKITGYLRHDDVGCFCRDRPTGPDNGQRRFFRKPQRRLSTIAKPSISIIKKKAGTAAITGGAWKVAYADFVTAMMALFDMWLLNSSKNM